MTSITARDRLIVALDFPTVSEARAFVDRAGPAITFYKLGLELVMSGGLDLARQLVTEGKRVFLDMKLLDIGNTVERATRGAAETGATFLTVHGHDGKTLRAAATGKAGTSLKVLAVTVLTNLDANDLREQGHTETVDDLVARRVRIAREAGCDGIVASGLEAAQVRQAAGPVMAIVTPGIRLAGNAAGDQARIATPQMAIAGGADYLVVGRPVTAAPDSTVAAEAYVTAIEEALALRSMGPSA